MVDNSRFLILPQAHCPNLGSRMLRLTLDRLSADWQDRYEHPLVVVETFVDPDQFNGTVYTAQGWQELGLTDGCGSHRRDYYVQHDKPKRLFVRELVRNAHRSLQAEHLKPALASQRLLNGVLPLHEPVHHGTGVSVHIGPLAGRMAAEFPQRRVGIHVGQGQFAALVNHAADDQHQGIFAPGLLAGVDPAVEFQLPGQVQQSIRSSVFALTLDPQRSIGPNRCFALAQSGVDLLDELRRQLADVTDGAVEDFATLPIALADERRALLGSALELDYLHIQWL